LVEDIPQVTDTESEMLVTEFSEKEIREAIFQMKHNKAPGPDGFPAEFYQVFLSLIKNDLMAIFENSTQEIYLFFVSILEQLRCFQRRRRSREFSNIGPYVCLMLVFRSFTKVLANRLTSVACRVTKPSQSVFPAWKVYFGRSGSFA
jgi:hypothetical protein